MIGDAAVAECGSVEFEFDAVRDVSIEDPKIFSLWMRITGIRVRNVESFSRSSLGFISCNFW